MRGGAQGQLMLGDDGEAWVVKFQNNPQHLRVLVNELMATKLAAAAGLTVPDCDVIEVTEWLAANTPEMYMDLGPRQEPCRPGLCFGSKLVGGLMPGNLLDYLPEEQLTGVKNLAEFAGILALDKWTCNVNGRQAVYTKGRREKHYTATFIDYGYCFNAGEWVFRDSPLRGVFQRNLVYEAVTGWESFEPWLSRIESMAAQTVWEIAETVPPEWYGGDAAAIEELVEHLMLRRSRVRELVESFRESNRAPFPNWGKRPGELRKSLFVEPAWSDKFSGGRVM
ncbi:phosphatidylinositol kinase [Silvibacterium dinghuense]|uniref:Phosphatidylinositol kinase n=2 Tax=Silvibacterium dinghuense TaxID=1560006 RepID=A0A4Q1SKK1_9BACT|nr:phosphatidylinositol kinase [Silvibacterium dinghuense]